MVEAKGDGFWVRAVRLGVYGAQRRYPKGASHPKAGMPFQLEKARDFSDSKRAKNPGWMERVEVKDESIFKTAEVDGIDAVAQHMRAVAAGGSPTAVSAATLYAAQVTAQTLVASAPEPLPTTVTTGAPVQVVTVTAPVTAEDVATKAKGETIVRRRGRPAKTG